VNSIEVSAKTVEEAIKTGLKELNCELTDVSFEYIDQGSPGLFGMFGRLARVKLTKKEQDLDLSFSLPDIGSSARPQNTKPEQKAMPAERPPAQKRAQKPNAHARKKSGPPARPEDENHLERQDINAGAERETPYVPGSLGEQGSLACDFLTQLTHLMGVAADIRTVESEGQIDVQITGDSQGVLIGRRGDTLDALQYLTSLVVNKRRSEYTRISLDVEHYRRKREESLVRLANRMAGRARKLGRVAMEPMNPYERRILHSALQGHPFVTTHSEGEEPFRRVIITLK
jgi:spoIIIJ-associated protein